jgi:hypothetical protein
MAREAVLGEPLEEETHLLILFLFVALCRILRTPCERAAEKVEALRHICTRAIEDSLAGILAALSLVSSRRVA